MMMDDDGGWMKKKGRKKLKIFVLSCRGWSGDLNWGTNRPKKMNPTEVTTIFFVIKWYGYQSIRTGLIKLLRPFLSRFEERKKTKKI